jgi:hypothetical protein
MKRAQVQSSVDGRPCLSYGDSLSGDVVKKIDWSTEYWLLNASFHYSITPSFQSSRMEGDFYF